MAGNELHGNQTQTGDIAGGDIHKNTYVNNSQKTPLREKIEALKEDCLHDPDFAQCIGELSHLINSAHPDEQRDLKTKLTDADRADEVHEAEELKEKFTKLLVKNSLSEQAQDAYAHVLCKIKLDYLHKIKPLLKSGASLQQVEAEVLAIINIIYADLVGTVLEHNVREIKGMLYFLTGNCHIEWNYNNADIPPNT